MSSSLLSTRKVCGQSTVAGVRVLSRLTSARCSCAVWVVRVGGGDGELRQWQYIYVYSIESRLMMGVRYVMYVYS